jgi:hypothetical protein
MKSRMCESEAVAILRFAVSAIWTELDSDSGCCQSAQIIAGEALELTQQFEQKGKDLTNQDIGIHSWRKYREQKRI